MDTIFSAFERITVTADVMTKLLITVAITIALFFARRILLKLLERIMHGFKIATGRRVYDLKIEEYYIKPVKHFLSILLFSVGALMVLGIWGLAGVLEGVVIGAGVAAVVLGFAAQGILADMMAGIMILLDHPLRIGDWVEVAGVDGIVRDISIRATRIRNFDGEVVTIPNRKMAEEIIINRSRNPTLRLRVDIGIDFNADVGKAIDLALDAVKSNDSILENPEPSVIVKGLGESSVNLEVRFWVRRMDRSETLKLKSEVITRVKKAFDDKGVKIPFPHLELIEGKKRK
jgi:small conductance mechanosensitive channel